MNTIHISATDLKNRISEIMNLVYYEKNIAVVERHGKVMAKIIPPESSLKKTKDLSSILNSYFGILPDFPLVTEFRYLPKRKISL